MSPRAAFIDVDQTLLTFTSIFRFRACDLAQSGQPQAAYEAALGALTHLREAGASREDTNCAFYRQFTGRSVAKLTALGERWFATEREMGSVFNPAVLAGLRSHQSAGDLVILLSGSFPPCLAPVARFVGADAVLCTEPEISEGRYTGHVPVPMVGANKATALRSFARSRGLTLRDCSGYGDDASDIGVLRAVGFPVVVGGDEVLRRAAEQFNWPRLPASSSVRPSHLQVGESP